VLVDNLGALGEDVAVRLKRLAELLSWYGLPPSTSAASRSRRRRSFS